MSGPITDPRYAKVFLPHEATYVFDQLELIPGRSILAYGKASIGFDDDGAWRIDGIAIDATVGLATHYLPREDPLYQPVFLALMREVDDINQHVDEALDARADEEDVPDDEREAA